MDLKLAQYAEGQKFVDFVVAERGITFATRVWERAENLPNLKEIRDPASWISRIDAGTDIVRFAANDLSITSPIRSG